MKENVAGGYAFFQKTRNPTKHVKDIFARTSIETGGQAPFLKSKTLENANIISNTTAPAPGSLAETRFLTEKQLREVVLNGFIPSAA